MDGFVDSLVDIESAYDVSPKKAQNIPEDYHKLAPIQPMQFSTVDSRYTPKSCNWLETVLYCSIGRYDLCNICNLDETPLPFECLSG